MKDADALIERILYLDGMPNLQRLGTVRVGETAPEKLEPRARARDGGHRAAQPRHRAVRRAAATTAAASCSRPSSTGEEEHADWLETQLELIRQVGEAHYLAQQIRD